MKKNGLALVAALIVILIAGYITIGDYGADIIRQFSDKNTPLKELILSAAVVMLVIFSPLVFIKILGLSAQKNYIITEGNYVSLFMTMGFTLALLGGNWLLLDYFAIMSKPNGMIFSVVSYIITAAVALLAIGGYPIYAFKLDALTEEGEVKKGKSTYCKIFTDYIALEK